MNRDRLIADAVARVIDLAPDYVAAAAAHDHRAGQGSARQPQVRACGRCTKPDRSPTTKCASRTSSRTCSPGGDGPPRHVTEQDILDLEREAFLRLLGTKETQERMQYTLKTGKPLRN